MTESLSWENEPTKSQMDAQASAVTGIRWIMAGGGVKLQMTSAIRPEENDWRDVPVVNVDGSPLSKFVIMS